MVLRRSSKVINPGQCRGLYYSVALFSTGTALDGLQSFTKFHSFLSIKKPRNGGGIARLHLHCALSVNAMMYACSIPGTVN